MKCPACGQENKTGLRFCVKCGTKLPEESALPPSGQLFCPNCGRRNPAKARFCEDCGEEILQPTVAAKQPPSVPPAAPVPQFSTVSPARVARSSGLVWLLSGLAVVVMGAGAFYFLNAGSAEAVSEDGGETSSGPVASLAPGTCGPDEVEIYREDFQDGNAEDWTGISETPPFFSIGPALDDPQEIAMIVQKPDSINGQMQVFPQLRITPFSNAVLRLRFYIDGSLAVDNSDWFSFNWIFAVKPFTLEGQEVFDSRYQLPVGFNYFEMRRLQQPLTNESMDRSIPVPQPGKWNALQIATYQPVTQVWLNGDLVMEYEDPNPLPAGSFGLEAWLEDAEVRLFFDDIAICELTAQYQP